jgi:hypothetical protein
MPNHSRDDDPRRASDARFARQRAELTAALRGLLGAREAVVPLPEADRAAALAAEARRAHGEGASHEWAIVRHRWPAGDRARVAAVLHGLSELLGRRASWLIVPGREPQAVALSSDVVLDNPFGFATLGGAPELVLLDGQLPAGLWLGPPVSGVSDPTGDGWELEVWGTEPWLSAATRAIRERRDEPLTD